MIIGKIHPGSGLGDQLFSYIVTRVIAKDRGYNFGFVGKEFFKGASFMNLDWGKDTSKFQYHIEEPSKELIIDHIPEGWWGKFTFNKPYYDPEVNFIQDGTVIDGYGAQDERYWEHRLDEIREWLKVEPLEMPNDLCVTNIRGGEYRGVKDLILPFDYWWQAIDKMKEINPNMKFEVHTDDIAWAYQVFPLFNVVKDIALNWRSIRYAKHLIISNSAFAILPALLNENVKEVIAPFGWNARNKSLTKWEGRPGNFYKKFIYI